MTVRRVLPYIVALLLGACAALIAACAGTTKGAIPVASASDLKSQLEDIRERVDAGRCGDLNGQLRQIDDRIDALPGSVDEQLKQALRDGANRLRGDAMRECNDVQAATQTQTETVPPVVTEPTIPPETTTSTTPTTTTPTTTTPTTTQPPSSTTPTVSPPPVEPPPVVGPGGGTPSEIPPQ
ncbi:MAG TPA: hypothetical protein VF526_13815 [Solirubrobacteraceae bacterium]|jgi:ABC-type Fe3+-hydroxamate transport system substrate-binding protein